MARWSSAFQTLIYMLQVLLTAADVMQRRILRTRCLHWMKLLAYGVRLPDHCNDAVTTVRYVSAIMTGWPLTSRIF